MDEQQRNLAEREYAKKKLPQWTDIDGIIYPRHISLEQCSSEQTAKYKSQLLSAKTTNLNVCANREQLSSLKLPRCSQTKRRSLNTFVDLTGGFGVDCYYIGKNFKSAFYIEQNPDLCETVKHNYKLLDFSQCTVICQDATNYLAQMPQADVIYIDPARRDGNGKRTYNICDCTPDVTKINDLLLQKADKVMIKLSPMFDWHKAVKVLHGVTEVHIVSVRNECKELLIILEKEQKPLKLFCINDDSTFIVDNDGSTSSPQVNTDSDTDSDTFQYLYEPNASIMKSGCFRELALRFGIMEISASSHLFLSDRQLKDFPGRSFQILSVSSMNKKALKEKVSVLKNANITTRNFPINANQLRKKLKLAEGGDTYIFATTTQQKEHLLFICKKDN